MKFRFKNDFFVDIALILGLLVIFLAFVASYLNDNILVIIFQIVGSFVPPILGVYLLGFFAPRVNSRVSLLNRKLLFTVFFIECSGCIYTMSDISNMDSCRS